MHSTVNLHRAPCCCMRMHRSTATATHVLADLANAAHSRLNRPRSVKVYSLYSFADVEPKEEGRKNRGRMKKEARNVRDIVSGMCGMTEKQLKAATVICGEEIANAVQIAARLPRTNQGRKRQESLVAKLLRTQLDEKALDKLAEAVELSRTSNNSYVDRELQLRVDEWREGLLEGSQETLQDVLTCLTIAIRTSSVPASQQQSDLDSDLDDFPGSFGVDDDSNATADSSSSPAAAAAAEVVTSQLPSPQEFKSLVRQCQQATAEYDELVSSRKPEANNQQPVGSRQRRPPSPSGNSSSDNDEDDIAQILQQAAAISRSRSGLSSGSDATAPGLGAAEQASPKQTGNPSSADGGVELATKKRRQLVRALNNVLKRIAAAQ